MSPTATTAPTTGAPDVLAMLDQVEDRDRPVLAMLLEQVHPDDIAATLGISGAAVRARRAVLFEHLTPPPAGRAATPTGRGVTG